MPAPEFANGNSLAVAVSEPATGVDRRRAEGRCRLRIRVARRRPAGRSARRRPSSIGRTGSSTAAVGAGRDERLRRGGRRVVVRCARGLHRELWAAIAAPGAAFGAPVRIGEVQLGSPFSLAVGAGGHALLAFAHRQRAAGRRARARRRVRPRGHGRAAPRTGFGVLPAAAVDADGGALVAWRGRRDGRSSAVVRAGPGRSARRSTLSRAARLPLRRRTCRRSSTRSRRWTPRASRRAERAATTEAGDPRALICRRPRAADVGGPAGRDGVWWLAPRSATMPLAGGAAEIRAHGAGRCATPTSITPLLAGGGGTPSLWPGPR